MERSVSLGTATTNSNAAALYTEAVPLSLSSLAHADLALHEGILDGLRQVVQHTLLHAVNYARLVHPPHQWTFGDLGVTEFAWSPRRETTQHHEIPRELVKLSFHHCYSQTALVYLKATIPEQWTLAQETERLEEWSQIPGILGRIQLLYTSTEPLTEEEQNGGSSSWSNSNQMQSGGAEEEDDDDMPPCILYKVVVEYRALPATGSVQAVQAEELSMLSFGGSVDDDVKYGALSSLYDQHAKYALEIYSIRGKKYKFDLMDATLADRSVPQQYMMGKGGGDATSSNAFAKSLCLTVRDHKPPDHDKMCAITRMHFTLEGKPRNYKKGSTTWHTTLPGFTDLATKISSSFLRLNPNPPEHVETTPSRHTLLLDPQLAGHIYINGKYATTWGGDIRIGAHGVALFGMDLHSVVPFWRGRIVDYEAFKTAYAQLWHEVLVDARLENADLASRLLCRLMYNDDTLDDELQPDKVREEALESLVLASPLYDPVGIAAKALQTCFKKNFGDLAYPCLPHETEWVRAVLPGLEPVPVPPRVLNILRRGGFFDVQRTADECWAGKERSVGDGFETEVVKTAVEFLETAGCTDVGADEIVIVSLPKSSRSVLGDSAVCRHNVSTRQFIVQEEFMTTQVEELFGDASDRSDPVRIKGYLLGMYIAKVHPLGKVLERYVVRNRP